MEANKVLYTNGQDVVVTPSTFQVKGITYKLIGITKHGMEIIRPERFTGIITLLLGIAMILTGAAGLPSLWTSDIAINSNFITVNSMAIWIGSAMIMIGVLLAVLVKQHYAVRISTAEGEKNVVISKKPEYISQIINALNHAFMEIDVKKSQMRRTMSL